MFLLIHIYTLPGTAQKTVNTTGEEKGCYNVRISKEEGSYGKPEEESQDPLPLYTIISLFLPGQRKE